MNGAFKSYNKRKLLRTRFKNCQKIIFGNILYKSTRIKLMETFSSPVHAKNA